MNSPQDPSPAGGLRQLAGVTALVFVAIVVSVYARNRARKMLKTQELLDTLPNPAQHTEDPASVAADVPAISEDEAVGEAPPAPAGAAAGDEPAAIEDDTASDEPAAEDFQENTQEQPLQNKTVEELYRLARQYDIAGRSNMRKAQLIDALQSEGFTEASA